MVSHRRSVLAASGALLAGAAGCLGRGDSGGSDDPDERSGDGSFGDSDDPDERGGDEADDDRSNVDAVVWRYGTPGSVATVRDGTVYGTEDFQGGSGGVVALEASTGDREWTYGETGGYSSYTQPVVDDAVYFGLGDDGIGSESGELYALEFDGTERWTAETGSVYDPPVLTDGTAYVGSDDGRVYAFETATGEERWNAAFDAEEPVSDPSVVAVDDDTVYATDHGTIRALEAEGGDERWRYDAGRRVADSVVADAVYFATHEAVGAVEDGAERWRIDFEGPTRIPGVRRETAYVAHAGDLYALDVADGTERWRAADAGAVHVHDDGAYVGTETLRSIRPTGEEEWQTALDGSELASIEGADESVYAVTDEGIHRVDTGGDVVADAPIDGIGSYAVDDRVYVGTGEAIYALEL